MTCSLAPLLNGRPLLSRAYPSGGQTGGTSETRPSSRPPGAMAVGSGIHEEARLSL